MAEEMTTVMISKSSVKKAKIIAAHEDKTTRAVVEEAIEHKLSKSRAVPPTTKLELAES